MNLCVIKTKIILFKKNKHLPPNNNNTKKFKMEIILEYKIKIFYNN